MIAIEPVAEDRPPKRLSCRCVNAKHDVLSIPLPEQSEHTPAVACGLLKFFLVVLSPGRTRVSLGEIGWWRLALGLVLYVVLLAVHGWLFGVNPWPLWAWAFTQMRAG